ncbi:hypothetical protein FGO68_gene317 [Halteria grandinella]|uniref:Transmembrane protein n=1 Tax=Halteria grandinella TaxID=5974 RepID=A0A8J8SY51_HALGN|nr:hypothetical protein FGO68_gene317 [Halteria grandinella]
MNKLVLHQYSFKQSQRLYSISSFALRTQSKRPLRPEKKPKYAFQVPIMRQRAESQSEAQQSNANDTMLSTSNSNDQQNGQDTFKQDDERAEGWKLLEYSRPYTIFYRVYFLAWACFYLQLICWMFKKLIIHPIQRAFK